MKLLIFTQKVDRDDDVLGFFHRWVEEFAKRCESVEVLALSVGVHSLPQNVHVHSLGKEGGRSRLKYVFNFYRYVWSLRREYDAVFVHMNPEYLVLGGFLWKLMRKRVVLWYVHRQVSWRLRVALFFADAVATTAPESMRAKSRKIAIVPHGIDTAAFSTYPVSAVNREAPRIISVGRITPIKNLETLLRAVAQLREGGTQAMVTLVGAPAVASDTAYEKTLHALSSELKLDDAVSFLGSRPNKAMPEVYSRYDVSVNLCPDGGIDKAVLESMAAGLPVLASNVAFKTYFGPYAERLRFAYGDPADLVRKLRALLGSADLPALQSGLRERAKSMADVSGAVSAIIGLLTHDPGFKGQL